MSLRAGACNAVMILGSAAVLAAELPLLYAYLKQPLWVQELSLCDVQASRTRGTSVGCTGLFCNA